MNDRHPARLCIDGNAAENPFEKPAVEPNKLSNNSAVHTEAALGSVGALPLPLDRQLSKNTDRRQLNLRPGLIQPNICRPNSLAKARGASLYTDLSRGHPTGSDRTESCRVEDNCRVKSVLPGTDGLVAEKKGNADSVLAEEHLQPANELCGAAIAGLS